MRFHFFLLLVFASFSTKAQTVYKTPSGKKYHLADCRMVKNVSKAIELSYAATLGLEPCSICNPQAIQQHILQGKPQGQVPRTTQCQGFTKAGNRCRHMTSIANGYCYQHQPK